MASSGKNHEQMDTMDYAKHIWLMLDNLADDDPEAYRKFIKTQLSQGQEASVLPQAHMCVRMSMITSGKTEPIYVNIMDWPRVPAPKTSESPIPLLGGPLLSYSDHNDGIVKVVAVAFNTQVLHDYGLDSKSSESDREMLVKLVASYIEDHNAIKLSESFSILPHSTRWKGPISKLRESLVNPTRDSAAKNGYEVKDNVDLLQNIVREKNGVVKDDESDNVPSLMIFDNNKTANAEATSLVQEISSTRSVMVKPEYSLTVVADSDSVQRHVVVKINLPGVCSVKECCLEVSDEDLSLLVPDRYELEISFPENVLPVVLERAKLNRRTSCLVLTLLASAK